MPISSDIKIAHSPDRNLWDEYVRNNSDASLFHLFGWREVIRNSYGHPTYYLMLTARGGRSVTRTEYVEGSEEHVLGVFPLVHLKHVLFGNCLVSLPFVDGGGILADSTEAEERLLAEAVRLGRKIGASRLEMRHERFLACCEGAGRFHDESSSEPLKLATRTDKVRMLLNLPESPELLMKSFKSKLRSQISKPVKEGLTSKTGGVELLEDFYKVFLVNMRDLGSPVHSKELMRNVLCEFPGRSRVIAIYKEQEPVAAALVVGSKGMLRNPWASFLRQYASSSPNMLLYLRMLEYACDNGYRTFDFGRSTKGEGTYKFKEQWGATPVPLYWQYVALDGGDPKPGSVGPDKYKTASHYWMKMPLVVTKFLGPRIRKHISL